MTILSYTYDIISDKVIRYTSQHNKPMETIAENGNDCGNVSKDIHQVFLCHTAWIA